MQNPNLRKLLRRYVNDSKRLKFKCKYPYKWSIWVAIKKKFSLKINKDIARRVRDKGRSKLEGDHIGQFGQWDYSHELKRTYPGSTIIIYYEKGFGMNNENKFKRMYVGLRPLIEGFKIGCRRLIWLDGCHTKGMYKQQILSAVGLDSNNGWWSIAWAVVEQENDKQKGLESAIREKFSYCEHRTCMHHLYNNFKKDNKGGDLGDKLWACARASNPIWFKTRMKQLQNIDKKAHLWLLKHANSPMR
ncbi:hypothetical protein LIER_10589 [Lithospermum erythrorhizon]|uniref:Uncharacterized protein n=1 Tax=Lithospermum erythrorhizon TaxID=34254 RepID=A0AAV3PLB5_LITER